MDNLDEIFDEDTLVQKEAKELTWGRGILLGVIFLGFQFLVAIPLAFTGMTDIGLALTLILSYIGTIYIGSRWIGMPNLKDKGIGFDVISLVAAFILLMAVKMAVGIPMEFIPGYEAAIEGYLETFGSIGICTMIIAATLGPIAEEVIFRGIIQRGMMNLYSPKFSIIVSSLIFGVIHFIPIQVVSAFFIGIVLAWIYYKTKSLWLPILLHIVNNSIAFLFIDDIGDVSESMIRYQIDSDIGAWGIAIGGAIIAYLLYKYLDKRWQVDTEFIGA